MLSACRQKADSLIEEQAALCESLRGQVRTRQPPSHDILAASILAQDATPA